MDIVLFGASGMVGSRVLRELVARGHKVTAVVRDPSRVATGPGVTAVQGDLTVASRVPSYLEGADAVVSAYSPAHGAERELLQATEAVLTGAKQAGVARVLIVGGAASLFIAPEVTLLDSGHLPEEWKAIARAHSDLLALIRKSDVAAELDWTYFSPAAFIQDGKISPG
jgi:putative NADH-flavin reductase